MKHVCYFRQALALDERRVKFLPEYAYGGATKPPRTSQEDYQDKMFGERPLPARTESTVNYSKEVTPQTLEVWFAGTHSDM